LKGLIEFEHLVLVYKSEGWESNNDSAAIMIDMVALNEWMKKEKKRTAQHYMVVCGYNWINSTSGGGFCLGIIDKLNNKNKNNADIISWYGAKTLILVWSLKTWRLRC
jgi:predicted nucleic acid-binding Zn ribbon protein